MDVARHQHDGLARTENLVALGRRRRAALKVEFAFTLFVPIQILDRLRRADFKRDERIVESSFAKLAQIDAVRSGVNEFQILDYLVPAGELAVLADSEAEELFGRLQLNAGRLRSRVNAGRHRQQHGSQNEGDFCTTRKHHWAPSLLA